MSWLTGLAGKAEDLLNKIDQNAAIALQKGARSQTPVNDALLLEVSSQEYCVPERAPVTSNSAPHHNVRKSLPAVKSYPVLPSSGGSGISTESSGKLKSSTDDDELMRFLNSPKLESKPRKKKEPMGSSRNEGFPSASVSQPPPLAINTVSDSKGPLEVNVDSSLVQSKDVMSIAVPIGSDAFEDFGMMPSGDTKSSEQLDQDEEAFSARMKLNESQQEIERLRKRLTSMEVHTSEMQDMYSRAIEDSKKIAEAAIAARFQAESELDRLKKEFSYSMDDKTRALEGLKSKMEGELVAANNKTSSLQRRYEAVVEELQAERAEQERYRARAQAVLAGRDREIAELRARGSVTEHAASESETFEREHEEERQMWEEEAVKLREEVARLRGMAEEARREWEGERERMEDDLLMERGRREAAEEQEKAMLQELRGVRAEMERLHQGEMELRQKLSKEEERKGRGSDWQGGGRASMVRDAVDDSVSERIAALTSTLVEKQIRVESLTAERNALRLQLEKTDHLYRDAVAHLGQGSSSSLPGQNDTDDVKARIPAFLLESPFDTAVARKVKRAYSSLDSVGVRVGIFLRRYPLARTLLLSYTVILHLWVVIVLLTYTPDVH
ncbi:golgin-84 [Ischnura elegans]|uniref:golgin-84 n=1 Tax=Ischnura elegans TaxID=197161 RepID=UPI001ED871FA|nr:golgin-84 [Ischnura elegans]